MSVAISSRTSKNLDFGTKFSKSMQVVESLHGNRNIQSGNIYYSERAWLIKILIYHTNIPFTLTHKNHIYLFSNSYYHVSYINNSWPFIHISFINYMINGAFNNDLPSVFLSPTFVAKRWINSSQFHKFRTPKSVASAEHSLAPVLHNYPVIVIAAFCSSHIPTHSVLMPIIYRKTLGKMGSKLSCTYVTKLIESCCGWSLYVIRK